MSEQKSLMQRQVTYPKATVRALQQEHALMAVAAVHHWPFQVLGVAPVPETPVFCNEWWLVPIAQDNSQIPARALERVQAIYQAGIRPKAFIVAHEAPQHLPAPADAPKISKLEFWSHELAKHSLTAAKVTGAILAGVVIPLSLTALGVGAMVALGLLSAMAADPCLIVVTEDNVWIQIDYWMA